MADTNSKLTVTNITNNTIMVLSQISDEVLNSLTVAEGVIAYGDRGLVFWDGDEWI